jgi:hypothetical protein
LCLKFTKSSAIKRRLSLKSAIHPIAGPEMSLFLRRINSKSPIHVKKIIVLALVIGSFSRGRAQVTVKKDVTTYFNQLPAPPTSIEEAYKNCHCLNGSGTVQANGPGVAGAVHASIIADAKSIGTLTGTENQQLQQAKITANQAKADNVSAMNKDQQLTWVQNNMQSYGNTAQAAAFAQKMQDPAEVAKFKAMTPAQKMAYLQANGIAPTTGAVPQTQAGNPAANAESAQTKMQQDLNSFQAGQYTGRLEALLAPSGAQNGDAQQKLVTMNNAYNSLLSFYRHTDSSYGLAMIAANYGYTGDSGQDKAVSALSAGQLTVLTQVTQLEGYLDRIYQYGATQQATKLKGGH